MIRRNAQIIRNKGTHKGTGKKVKLSKQEKRRKTEKNLEIRRFQGFSMAGAQGLELQRKPDSSFEHYGYA